jgi:uncharacterized membrane protein
VSLAALALPSRHAVAQTAERGLSLIVPYSRIVLTQGEEVTFDASVENSGKRAEDVRLLVGTVPAGWEVTFLSRFPRFEVKGVRVQPGKTTELDLKVKVPKEAALGEYKLQLTAESEDRQLSRGLELLVQLGAKGQQVDTTAVNLTSRYFSLSGPSGSEFAFYVEVQNETGEDRSFDLRAGAPPGWDVWFQPQFDIKRISSVSVKKFGSETVQVVVKSPGRADPKNYEIPMEVRSGPVGAKTNLTASITGTYDLRVGTSSGILNAKATAGQLTVVGLVLGNAGTASINNLSFLSTKPQDWRVEFSPDRIDSLAPNAVREVNVSITPAQKAIAGDYALTLTVSSPKTTGGPEVSRELNLRMTVLTPTIWGWVGIGIVVVVVSGLLGLFLRLGRR